MIIGSVDKTAETQVICLLLSSDKVFIILMKGSFVCIINGFEHLNFTTNGCSFFIHLISEKQYSIKIQQLCGFQPLSRLCRE